MALNNRLAGIGYVGVAGVSADCLNAVMRMLQFDDRISKVRILSCGGSHCLLLTIDELNIVAVKSGFGSGYVGEGPHTFATALQLLRHHGHQFEEFEVSQQLMDRLDASALTARDIESIDKLKQVRPTRWSDYIYDPGMWDKREGELWGHFRTVIPFAIIDARIADLALKFLEQPNESLLQGFRRLEDLIRARTDLKESGSKLFSQAFQGDKARLEWNGLDPSEAIGRTQLFTGAYMAHRNPHAHREIDDGARTLLSEFLLLNHLFVLERGATRRAVAAEE